MSPFGIESDDRLTWKEWLFLIAVVLFGIGFSFLCAWA